MLEKIKAEWDNIKTFIRSEYEMGMVSYTTWIEPLIPNRVYKNDSGSTILEIIVPEAPYKSFLEKKYSIYIRVAVQEVTSVKCDSITYVTEEDIKGRDKKTNPERNIIETGFTPVDNDIIKKANLNPRYTFDAFVVGKSNNLAHAASLAVAESPGEIYNPLFLYGGAGLGKTHLMHSIAHFILEKDSSKKVLYVTSETFTNDVVESIMRNRTFDLRNKYRTIDVLLIDDIQFIIGKEQTQVEFFNTFNELQSLNKQIIISSDKPPRDFNNLESRFRSRFEMGLTVDIQPPDYETRLAILRKKEETEHYNIDDEIIKYIASKITSNIRVLEGALTRVMAMGRLDHRDVTLELAMEALKDIIDPDSKKVITPEMIIDVVCDHFSISKDDLLGSKRNKEIVYPRQIAMYLIRNLTNTSQEMTGTYLGGRDHSTVVYGINKITREIVDNKDLINTVEVIKKKLSAQ